MGHEDLHEEDWKDEAPLLASLAKNGDWDVPEGYFDAFPSQVMARIQAIAAEDAPVIAMPQPMAMTSRSAIWGMKRSIFWSAAAGILLLMAVGTYFVFQTTGTVHASPMSLEEETMAQLANVGTEQLIDGLNPHSLNDDQLFAMLGKDGATVFEGHENAVQRDDAYEYLQDLDLDAIDLQGLDINLEDI